MVHFQKAEIRDECSFSIRCDFNFVGLFADLDRPSVVWIELRDQDDLTGPFLDYENGLSARKRQRSLVLALCFVLLQICCAQLNRIQGSVQSRH